MSDKITTFKLKHLKEAGQKISVLTAYDHAFARLLDEAGIDILLVGDSLGMVALGHETTLPVTMEMMLHHTAAVARAARRALVVADMPFLSYQVSIEEAVRNAGRFLQEAGAKAVKLEGGQAIASTVRRLTELGIPVMGHLGFTPQSVHRIGGHRVQGRSEEAARRMIEDARALEAAGAFAIVLELVPKELSALITESVSVPTIGIGAGPACDGQVLVIYDILGLFERPLKHSKTYAPVGAMIREAARAFREEIASGAFPSDENSFSMEEETLLRLKDNRVQGSGDRV
ncbi:MAG: 3-methyl-2-oxobutanoate hydroxymethyltransferase [Armatimonadetes bacterium]|nr:3-methyl-2-oxobutanoate hydroxymethyltransferase [Armatimonadota bacterium]